MPPIRSLILALVLAVGASPARAQIVDVPPFVVIETADIRYDFGIASGPDSAITFSWGERVGSDSRRVYARHFSAAGAALGGATRLDETGDVTFSQLLARPGGGFLATWERFIGQDVLDARLLSATGVAVGPTFTALSGVGTFPAFARAVRSSGFVLVWNNHSEVGARLLNAAGQAVGADVVVRPHDIDSSLPIYAAGTADGGFVVAWAEGDDLWARVYDASGAPLSDAAVIAPYLEINRLVASPLGGFAVVATNRVDSHARPSGVWVRRYDGYGVQIGTPFLVDAVDADVQPWPHAVFDAAGRLVITWRAAAGDEPRARAYDPAGVPVGPMFRILDDNAVSALAVRPDGRLVVGWQSLYSQWNATVLSLCVPPAHTGCGNGVLESLCERCDDGAGNSDTTPNACRTGCYFPSCGDGVTDFGEECDDGNTLGCDGCDTECNAEPGWICGDGVTSTDCEEECDRSAR